MSENKYRDTSGRNLTDYPRPSVAVDTAVLALDPEQGLVVLEVRRPTGMGWALPGTFIHEGETLAEAVDRSLRAKPMCADYIRVSFTSSTTRRAMTAGGCCP
jgi:hypothetical protein